MDILFSNVTCVTMDAEMHVYPNAFVGVTGVMRIATGVSGVIGGPAFAFAGQTFPVMAMPFALIAAAPIPTSVRMVGILALNVTGNSRFSLEPSLRTPRFR